MNKYEKYIKDRKSNRIIAMVLIVLLLSLLLLEVYRIFCSDAYYEDVLDFVEVPVLLEGKSQREVITEADIGYRKIPASYLSEDIILNKTELIGTYVKLGSSVNKDMPVSNVQLETGSGFSDFGNTLLNEKQIVFPITISLMGSSGNNIRSSMNVDVFLTVENEDGYQSDLLLENVRILDVKNSEGRSADECESDFIPYIVLLAVNEEYAPMLNIAKRIGDLDLYITDDSYNSKKESILNENSKIITYVSK